MNTTTFVLLTDPQEGKAWIEEKVQPESNLNVLLNSLYAQRYPNIPGITCADQPITRPNAVFFAGDMTQFGGNYSCSEQSNLIKFNPSNYVGGGQLKDLRALYDPQHPREGVVQLTGCGPLYFGLGNHDFASGKREPGVGFRFFNGTYSDADNFYRYQMWNFISQMHTGYRRSWATTSPRYAVPTDQIDSTSDGTYEYMKYSLNYFVDMGPVDVYHLHRYGGDADHGRKSGLNWLKLKLAAKGYTRPIIIVQHFEILDKCTDSVGTQDKGTQWTPQQRDNLLEALLPYNVLAFLAGHQHVVGDNPEGIMDLPNNRYTLPAGSPAKQVREYRPGWAAAQHFAVFRVEAPIGGGPVTLNALYGTVPTSGTTPDWTSGSSVQFDVPSTLYVRDIEVVYQDQDGENSDELPTLCTELSNQDPDINDGFGGKFVYIRPLLTTDKAQAITGISLKIQKDASPDPGLKDLAKGAGGDYRYAVVERDSAKTPITGLFLLRSSKAADVPAHMAGMTGDINRGREKSFLYLVWRTWTNWTLD